MNDREYIEELIGEAEEQDLDAGSHVLHVIAGNIEAGNYDGTPIGTVGKLLDTASVALAERAAARQ